MPNDHRSDDGEDELPKDLSQITPGYRRALRIVAGLNVGYAAVEIIGSFTGRSEALRADAVDFFGDGLITGMALLATRWDGAWRAKAALIQGFFLAALGLWVVGASVYRVFVMHEPLSTMMGLFGAMALAVNVTAALVLRPHRKGDANARAVWLFSRNDALGNLAVLIAAALVYWSGTRWPDLAAGAVIGSFFLHSASSIIADARRDLRSATAAARDHEG